MNKERWLRLMESMQLPPSLNCFDKLLTAYSEPHRHYHTGEHIQAMLSHLDDSISLAKRPLEVELAIWFHDAIYQPLSSKNELDSANWATAFLTHAGYPQDSADRIHQLILATQSHQPNTDQDTQLLLDIDLSILGASNTAYDVYEANIRKEYRMVPSFIYRKKRKQVLSNFLSLNPIFVTEFYRQKLETSARSNLSRAIKNL